MIPYVLIYLCFLFAVYFDDRPSQNAWYYFLFIAATVMAGLRDMIGGFDVYIYGELFEVPVALLLSYTSIEYGYILWYAFLKLFSDNRHFMFMVMAFILLFFQFRIYKKYSPLLLFALFIFFAKFFLMSFVYLRQGTAMALLTFAIPLAQERKYIKFFILVAIAFTIHRSAIMFLPFIFVVNRNFTTAQLFMLISAVMLIALTPLNNLLFGFLGDNINDAKVAMYASQETSINIFYFAEVVVLSFILLQYKEEFYKNPTTKMIANGLFMYILVSLLGLTNPSFIRFCWYYLPFFVLGIAYFISFQQNSGRLKLFKASFLLYFSLLFFRLLILYDDGDLMPYKTIFEDYNRNGRFEYMEYRDNYNL